MEYYVGQIFIDSYPPEAASWCNETGEDYIAEIEPDELGRKRYQIKKITFTTEEQQAQARTIRDEYFGLYVDWYQSKPLLWAEMSETDKTDIENYREYLKHYTDAPEWWLNNPKTFDEWKAGNNGE